MLTRYAGDARIEARGGTGRPAPGAPATAAFPIVRDQDAAPIVNARRRAWHQPGRLSNRLNNGAVAMLGA